MNNNILEAIGFVCSMVLGVGLFLFSTYIVVTVFEIRDEVYNIKNQLKKKNRRKKNE